MIEPQSIVVIGDVMLDRRSEGEMRRISLEAPAPVVHQLSLTDTLGGAGNVARNIVALGHHAYLLGVVGRDEPGERLRQLASESGVTFYCHTSEDTPTTLKHRITCGGKITQRLDVEAPPRDHEDALIAGIESLQSVDGLKLIVISDYGKGTMTEPVVAAVRALAAAKQLPIFVDARPHTMHMYRRVSLLKPNMREALGMLSDSVHPGLEFQTDRAYVAASLLRQKYEIPLVLVTDGSNGCAYTDPDDNFQAHGLNSQGPSDPDSVRDICGAGDTTMAAVAVGFVEGKPFSTCALFAMQAAGFIVQFYGVHCATRDQLEEHIYTSTDGYYRKLLTQEQAIEFVARRRRLFPNQRIVLTNGCFDGLHYAHMELLRFAKKHGSTLLVAYNDDDSLRACKGEGRPRVPDSYRATHLAMQDPVDVVFRFVGDTADMVRRLDPDVLVKGGDCRDTVVPGADYVANKGGQVVFGEYTDWRAGVHTSNSQ